MDDYNTPTGTVNDKASTSSQKLYHPVTKQNTEMITKKRKESLSKYRYKDVRLVATPLRILDVRGIIVGYVKDKLSTRNR